MEILPYCGCGCGERVKYIFSKFLRGHNNKNNPNCFKKSEVKIENKNRKKIFIENSDNYCICGEIAKWYYQWTNKWWCSDNVMRCKVISNKVSGKIKEKWKDKECRQLWTESFLTSDKSNYSIAFNKPEVKENRKRIMHNRYKDELERKKQSDRMKEVMSRDEMIVFRERLRKEMKDGKASYMTSLVRSPSKPQIELFNLCQQVFPYPILNYPVIKYNKNIDIAIPSLAIAFEYDCWFWHQDKEKDIKREILLKEEGWIVIRYLDRIPSKEELLNDVNEALKNEMV